MLSLNQKAALATAIAAVQQRNSERRSESLAAATGTKKPAAKKASTAKPKTKKPASTISPYLTANDLLDTSTASANAENAVSNANFGLASSVANAYKQQGDIGRATVKNVSDANNDAASRGLYNSGIRAGNVGMAQQAGARGLQAVQTGLGLSAAQNIARKQAAKTQFGDFLTAMTAKAAENGAALPVDPGYGVNVKKAPTLKKTVKAK